MIYILFPTPTELEPLTSLIASPEAVYCGRMPGIAGRLGGCEVTVAVSGVGQANTAHALTAILESGTAELVILGGCAGAYIGSGLVVGDVAVATSETYADLGVETLDGWKSLSDIGLPLLDMDGDMLYETYGLPAFLPPPHQRGRGAGGLGVSPPLNPPLLPGEGVGGEGAPMVGSDGVSLSSPSPPAGEGGRGAGGVSSTVLKAFNFKLASGPFLTVSTITGTAARGRELFARFGALCENMEGAAAAQVAAMYGVPFAEVRGISNMVEDRDRDAWDVPTATANCALVIERIVSLL